MKLKRESLLIAPLLLAGSAAFVFAQNNSFPSKSWPFPLSYESVTASPDNHKTRYEDDHVRLIEVTMLPGTTEKMHGHPYASVFARDSVLPMQIRNVQLDPASPLNGQGGGQGAPPTGRQFPTCSTMGPQAPHAASNDGAFPAHFYRVEFKRTDGDDIKTKWKEWYPWMLDPLKPVRDLTPGPQLGPAASKEFPYPMAYDSYKAAPNNHQIRYEDDHIRFIEVTIRPGEKENMHGHPYASVFAFDTTPNTRDADVVPDVRLDPNSPMNGQDAHQGPAPAGLQWPSCMTMGPQAPHQGANPGMVPIHFYRIEFKRIDGEDIKKKWKEWYPWMVQQNPATR